MRIPRFVDEYLGYLLGQANHALYKDFDVHVRAAGLSSACIDAKSCAAQASTKRSAASFSGLSAPELSPATKAIRATAASGSARRVSRRRRSWERGRFTGLKGSASLSRNGAGKPTLRRRLAAIGLIAP